MARIFFPFADGDIYILSPGVSAEMVNSEGQKPSGDASVPPEVQISPTTIYFSILYAYVDMVT